VALQDAVLTALLDGEASGYDLAKAFNASVANFWTATPQQLYRELERMEAEGLIRARLIRQDSRPNKRLFALTDTGRDALHRFTAEPAKPTGIRDELLVKVQAVEAGDIAAVRDAVAELLERADAKLARYESRRARLLDGRPEDDYLANADRVGPYLTLLRGIQFEKENVRWAKRVLGVLTERMPAPAPPQ
jgi:DNA-binding PadR family transcriptional regulator